MNEIKMVDLVGQYLKIKKEIDQSIERVILSSAFINGPDVKEFKDDFQRYLGCKYVIPCANGTDALQVSLMALGLQRGDEIITTGFTFIATLEVIALLGLTPVIVDVDPQTFNISPEKIAEAITSKTKAIIPVHLFGQCAAMEDIMEIARQNDLFVIEDAAQAVGCNYQFKNRIEKKAGTIGHIGCTSFFPSKNLGCYGDGGAIITNDDNLAMKMHSIVNHGAKVKYYHESVGINSRLDSIQAAILRVKLKHLDQYIAARQKVAVDYDQSLNGLQGIKIPFRSQDSVHVFHQYTLILDGIDREKLAGYLKSNDIPTMVYYPVPLHRQEAYGYLNYKKGDFPVTEYLCDHVLSLPMHTELEEDQIQYIVQKIHEWINNPSG